MADKPGIDKCKCGESGVAGAQASGADEDSTRLVEAEVPQDYKASFNLRIVPGRSLESALRPSARCTPRGSTAGWAAGTPAIEPGLVATLARADKAMIAWLAKDAANAKAFLANPVAAMREAGIKLSRPEEKALARAHEAARASRVVAPGVNIDSIEAQAFPNGRVGGVGTGKPAGKTDDFGCGPKRKG